MEHLRPTVVVRRRVPMTESAEAPPPLPAPVEASVDEEQPPSSIFVHPGYLIAAVDIDDDDPPSSVFDDEDDFDDEETSVAEPVSEPVEAAPPSPRRQLTVAADTSVGAVAKQLGLSPSQVASELVLRGLFSVTPKTTVSTDTLRVLGDAFDCDLLLAPAAKVAPRRKAAPKARPVRRRK